MKIKTLLVFFLAVCAMSLTSCNKGKYVQNYVGTYNMTVTPVLTMTLMGEQQDFPTDAIGGFVCVISQIENSAEVSVTITENAAGATPLFEATAECDELGMHINEVQINETMSDETFGNMDMNVIVKSATALEPVGGQISWESNVGGSIGMNVMGIKIEAPLTGKIGFVGTRI